MQYPSRINLTNPINGRVAEAFVLGDPDRTRGAEHYPAYVYISIEGGVSFQVRMTPREARQLAQHLTAAADVAEPHTTEPKAVPLTLVEAAA